MDLKIRALRRIKIRKNYAYEFWTVCFNSDSRSYSLADPLSPGQQIQRPSGCLRQSSRPAPTGTGLAFQFFPTRHSLLRNEYFHLNIRYLLSDVFSKSDFL